MTKIYVDDNFSRFDEPHQTVVGHDEVAKEVDFFYEFKDKVLRAEYTKFRIQRLSYISIIFVAVVAIFFATPSSIVVLVRELMGGSNAPRFPQRIFLSCGEVVFSSLISICSVMVCWIKLKSRKNFEDAIHTSRDPTALDSAKLFRFYFTMLHMALVAFFNFTFLRRSLSYNCIVTDSFAVELFGGRKCNEDQSLVVGVALDATILIVNPFLTFVGISSISSRFIWFNMICSVVNIVAVSCYLKILPGVSQQLVVLVAFACVGIADLHYSRVLEFFYFRQSLQLNEEVNMVKTESEAVFKEEMRLLIGNVAHDIKSPLTSFVTGLDYMEQILLEWRLWHEQQISHQSNHSIDKAQSATEKAKIFHNRLNDMENCIESLRSTYFFALAIINRSTDFYRSMIGANLIPMKDLVDVRKIVLESIRYVEGIAMSKARVKLIWEGEEIPIDSIVQEIVKCRMGNSTGGTFLASGYNSSHGNSSEIEITNHDLLLKKDYPIANEKLVSSVEKLESTKTTSVYMNTDEDWLRENLLCLISNGLKFSNDGDVLVSISKFEEVVDAIQQKRMMFMRFSVIDRGLRLTDEALNQFFVFGPEHYRQQQESDTGGIGLGLLALSKRIDALDGKYGANRRLDGLSGTEVWFAIPYRESKSMKKVATYLNVTTAADRPYGSFLSNSSPSEISFQHSRQSQQSCVSYVSMDPSFSAALSIPSNPSLLLNPPPIAHGVLHCLVVDDSSSILKMLSMMLRKVGFVVSTATHGKGAVELMESHLHSSLVRSQLSLSAHHHHHHHSPIGEEQTSITIPHIHSPTRASITSTSNVSNNPNNNNNNNNNNASTNKPFDIILMDIQMPVMNGLEAMKAIRELEQQHLKTFKSSSLAITSERIMMHATPAPLPVIMIAMSANSEFSTYQDAINAGADSFLNKPFTMELFQKTLYKIQKKKGFVLPAPHSTSSFS